VGDRGTTLALGFVLAASAAGTALIGPEHPAPAADAPPAGAPLAPQTVAAHLARHYRIGTRAAAEAVSAAYMAGEHHGVDPLLVLAVIGVESSFNAAAESVAGAKGLMQIVPYWHAAALAEHGGEDLVLHPFVNVALGTRILNEYVERTGSLEAGLQRYNGAAHDETARYARKVLAERERLERSLLADAGP
jgi:soluble lytic murein transglycosylase-like protein